MRRSQMFLFAAALSFTSTAGAQVLSTCTRNVRPNAADSAATAMFGLCFMAPTAPVSVLSATTLLDRVPGCDACTGMPNRPEHLPVILDWDGGTDFPLPGIPGEIGGQSTGGLAINPSRVRDTTGPMSPGFVRRHRMAAGGAPGQQVGGGFVAVFVKDITEMYMARWLRPSENLVGAGDGSKSGMIGFSQGGAWYMNYETTPNALQMPINLQGRDVDDRNDRWLGRNRASTPIERGKWGLWEFYIKLNDPGVKNGIVRGWTNGVLQYEYTDWLFRPAGQTWGISNIKSDFYQNQSQPFEMWWDMDHFFVSGR